MYLFFREAAKKVPFLVARPLRRERGAGKGLVTKKKELFEALKKNPNKNSPPKMWPPSHIFSGRATKKGTLFSLRLPQVHIIAIVIAW